jgi:hypothetical protein
LLAYFVKNDRYEFQGGLRVAGFVYDSFGCMFA